jgi:VIT1/CCC1 family predicted Fe2+/Mn2+ transporter
LGCLACYLGSDKQQIIVTSINKKLANSALGLGYFLGVMCFAFSFPFASSLLAGLVVLMLSLVSHTILNVYIKKVMTFNVSIIGILLFLTGLSYVA